MNQISEVKNLDIFYNIYSKEFIEEFTNNTCRFYQISNIGNFVSFKDSHFPDVLFFGLCNFSSLNFNFEEFKNILRKDALESSSKLIVGPIDFNIWFGNRFKTQGFQKQFFWEPKGHINLKEKLNEVAFESDKKYVTHFIDDIRPFVHAFSPSYNKAIESGVKIIGFDEVYKQDPEFTINTCYKLNLEAFQESHYYRPITFEQYKKYIFNKLIYLDNSLSCFAEVNGEIVGYSFTIIDKDEKGDFAILKSIAVHPSFQQNGIASTLIFESLRRSFSKNIFRGAGALVREGAKSEFLFAKVANDLSRSHNYELFQLKLD